MPKEDGQVMTRVDLVHEVDAKLSFAYYDRHNKFDFSGHFDAPNLIKDSQLQRLTYERKLHPTMNSVDLVHGVDPKSSFVYYDRHNKFDFSGQFDAPSPLVKDSQLRRLTYERKLHPTMDSVDQRRGQVPVKLYNLSNHADLLKRC